MFFRELNIDMLSLENGGSFWQYCKLEAHEGPYCIHFEVLDPTMSTQIEPDEVEIFGVDLFQ